MKFIKEPLENMPKDHYPEDFYFKGKKSLQNDLVREMPKGYNLVVRGITRPGDILYSCFMGWDVDDPFTTDKIWRQVIYHGVGHFHGVARPTK